MWPFDKSSKIDQPNQFEIDIKMLREFRDIGDTFNYLGRTCIVTGHCEGYPGYGYIPKLLFDYADNMGVIHSASVSLKELPGIIKQQKKCDQNR